MREEYHYFWRLFHTSVDWWSFTFTDWYKSPQVSNTLLSTLVDLNNAIVSSSDFHFFQPYFYAFEDCSKRSNYNCNHRHPHILKLSQFSSKVQVLISFLPSLIFILWFAETAKSTIRQILFFFLFSFSFCIFFFFFFLLTITGSGLLTGIKRSIYYFCLYLLGVFNTRTSWWFIAGF